MVLTTHRIMDTHVLHIYTPHTYTSQSHIPLTNTPPTHTHPQIRKTKAFTFQNGLQQDSLYVKLVIVSVPPEGR